MLVIRNVNPSNTGHSFTPKSETLNFNLSVLRSTLALLVTRIGTDDSHHALATNDLAVAAQPLYRSLNSHFLAPVS
jgi:hypothetical protein